MVVRAELRLPVKVLASGITKLEFEELVHVGSFERLCLWVDSKDLGEGRNGPEVVDAFRFLTPKHYLVAVVLHLLLVSRKPVFTVLRHRQLVDHGIPRKEVGPPSHFVGLVQQLELQVIMAKAS